MVKGPEQLRCGNMWDACINQPRDKKERSRARKLKARYTETTMPLAEAKPTLPLAEARRTLSLAETEQHSQRREGTQRKNKLWFRHHGTGDTFELIRICWTLKSTCREQDAFQLTRNSLDTIHPRGKRCHVCRDFTAARCDHGANGYT